MVDNPFSRKLQVPLEIKPLSTISKTPEPSKERLPDPEPISKEEKLEREKNLAAVQRILSEYNGLESDIPTSHPEYWNAKRRL